jgi:hypothetical protein
MGKTPQEAFQALTKSIQEKLQNFKDSQKNEYTPDEVAYILKQEIKEKIIEFQDSLVKLRALEKGEILSKKSPPDVSEAMIHKLKDEYGHDQEGKEKAFATAWKIHNRKKGKKANKSELPMAKAGMPGMRNMPKDMHALASRHATSAAKTPVASKPQLPMPSQAQHAARAQAHQSALAGDFQPKGAIVSGLQLDRSPKTFKAEPGQMTSPALLQIGHAKPTLPIASADKHPKPQPALPIHMHPPQSEVAAQGPLKKDIHGLPNSPPTMGQMSNQLSKNVFKMVGKSPVQKGDVIHTTFKAEDKPERSIDHKPVKNPNALTNIKGKDIKDIDRSKYERELYELHHKQAALPSDKLPNDANSKDTGAGGQIQKGKLNKDEWKPGMTLNPGKGNPNHPGLGPAPTKPFTPPAKGNSPVLTGMPKFKTPEAARQASLSFDSTNTAQTSLTQNPIGSTRISDKTNSQRPPVGVGAFNPLEVLGDNTPPRGLLPGISKAGVMPSVPKLSQQTLQNKNAKMPAQQQSTKMSMGTMKSEMQKMDKILETKKGSY